MKKILHIALNGPYTEGFSYQDNLLPKYHARLGFDVAVLAPAWRHGKNGALEHVSARRSYDGRVLLVRMETANEKGLADRFKVYPGLLAELEGFGPDIIFLHGCQFRDAKTVVNYIQSCSVKPVLYVDNHADYSNSATNFISRCLLHRIVWRRYAKLLEPYVMRFWGVLPARVDFLVENYGLPRQKCSLLVMGGDDDEVKRASDETKVAETKKKFCFEDSDFVIVTGGKIDEAKRQVLALMDAVAEMNGRVKMLVFGPVVPSLKSEFDKRLDCEQIIYVPWANTSDSYDYFAIADLVVFPGRHSVYWEQAAAMGKPLLIKHWDGTTHVDCGGNVAYMSGDDVASIEADLIACTDPAVNSKMKTAAHSASRHFLYSDIACRSIGYGKEGLC